MSVGQNLKRLRLKHTKLSQQDIADVLQVDRNTVANWEKGSTDIKSEYIPKIATTLGVEIAELFEKDNSNITIQNNKNIGKEHSILNGAVIILNDKETVEKLVSFMQNNIIKK